MKIMRAFGIVIAVSLLSGCIPRTDRERANNRPKQRPPAVATSAEMRACVNDLNRLSARYTILPAVDHGSGCSSINSVLLIDASVPITNVTAIQCPMARALTQWTRESVQSAARSAFGGRVTKIETMGAYSCRNVIGGRGSGRSEHATANAVDVSAFILSDGRRISIKSGWYGESDEREFLRLVRAAACKRFNTVLSPEYNAAHHDHLHFDLGRTMKDGSAYCR
jgi:hypothetical protein